MAKRTPTTLTERERLLIELGEVRSLLTLTLNVPPDFEPEQPPAIINREYLADLTARATAAIAAADQIRRTLLLGDSLRELFGQSRDRLRHEAAEIQRRLAETAPVELNAEIKRLEREKTALGYDADRVSEIDSLLTRIEGAKLMAEPLSEMKRILVEAASKAIERAQALPDVPAPPPVPAKRRPQDQLPPDFGEIENPLFVTQ